MINLLKFFTVLVPILILVIIGVIGWWFYMKVRFKTATSNQALIVTGPNLFNPKDVDEDGVPLDKTIFIDDNGRSMKIIRGGGHRLRMFQTSTKVDLKSFNLSVKSTRAYSKDAIPLSLLATAVVSVGEKKQTFAKYAEKYLGKKDSEVQSELTDVLEGYLRAIISTLDAKSAYQNYEMVNEKVRKIAVPALEELGFDLSFSIKKIEDDAGNNEGLGYIEALGQPQIETVRKDAEISKSENEKLANIKKAKDEREAEEARIENAREVARIRKQKDLEESAIKEETERARAKSEQSYLLEKAIRDKEVKQEELKIVAQEKEEELRIKHLERERLVALEKEEAKVRKEKADADYYETTKRAQAKAEEYQIAGETEAKVGREKGLSEAEVIREKGRAEAESKRLFAEAISQHGEVIIVEKLIEMLPLYAREIAMPLSQIDSVKIIDSGDGNGMTGFSKGIAGSMAQLQETVKETTGIDIKSLLTDVVNRGNTHTVIRDNQVIEEDELENQDELEKQDNTLEATLEENVRSKKL